MEDLIHLHNGQALPWIHQMREPFPTDIFGNNEKYSPLLDIKLIFFFSLGRTL